MSTENVSFFELRTEIGGKMVTVETFSDMKAAEVAKSECEYPEDYVIEENEMEVTREDEEEYEYEDDPAWLAENGIYD